MAAGADGVKLRNLGRTSARMLAEVGIDSAEKLQELGAVPAYCLVKSAFPDTSRNLLWAIYGALKDIDWRDVSAETKAQLDRQVAKFQFA